MHGKIATDQMNLTTRPISRKETINPFQFRDVTPGINSHTLQISS